MRRYERQEVKRQEDVLIEIRCDLCGCHGRGANRWRTDDSSEVKYTTVQMEDGYRYPEGGCVEITDFDICTDCFRDKLIPWMKEQGAEPQIREED